MIWTLLISVHLIGIVGYTLLLRKSALSSINKYALAALMQTSIVLPGILFFLPTGKVQFNLETIEWFKLITAGLLVIGLHLTTIRALQFVEASLFTIIYNLRLLLATILGFVFLHEIPSKLQLLGGLIIFTSILMLNLHKERRYASKPILYALLATVWLSIYITLEKNIVVSIGFETYVVLSGVIGSTGLWILAFKKGLALKEIKTHIDKSFVALLLFRPMSSWGSALSFKYGSLAVSSYVSGMSVTLIVIFGIFILKEKEKMKEKFLAAGVALIGLTLILISKL